MAAANKRNQEE